MSIVSGVYTHYETLELPGLTRNPIRNVRRLRLFNAPPKRTRHAPPVSLPTLIRNIWGLRNGESRDLLLLYTLGALRKIAGMRLRKSIIDFNAGVINVPKGERGWKGWHGTYPLNSQVLGILRERAEATGPGTDWLFPARHGDGEHREDVRGSIEKASAGLPFVLMPHDLRRTFGTICDILFPSDVALAGALLTHRWAIPENPETSLTFGYQQRSLEELRHASDTVANAILEIAGVLPMTDATSEALRRRGINPEKLELVESDDGDDKDE
jgi:integrase